MIDLQLWKERKKALKLSLQDIANETGISISTLKDIFRGATAAPRIDTVSAIEMVLEIKIHRSPITDNLKRFRINAGISRAQMAQFLDIPQITYLSIECGFLDIPQPMLKIICKTLKISEKDFLGRTAEEIQDITTKTLKSELLQQIDYIDLILSNADIWDKFDHYNKLSDIEKKRFVYFLLCEKSDLPKEKEMLLRLYKNCDEHWLLGYYQNRPELWGKHETKNDDENR